MVISVSLFVFLRLSARSFFLFLSLSPSLSLSSRPSILSRIYQLAKCLLQNRFSYRRRSVRFLWAFASRIRQFFLVSSSLVLVPKRNVACLSRLDTHLEQHRLLVFVMSGSPGTDEPQSLHVPPSRIRSHSLKIRHSKQDYARRKSAADATANTGTRLELSTDSHELEHTNTPPPRRASMMWFQRRFTMFAVEQQQDATADRQRRMTTGRFSLFDEKSSSDLLKQRRPRVLSQMVEVVYLSLTCWISACRSKCAKAEC